MGRVDAWVSSTDKNFMVPVGGAIVASPDPAVIEAVSRCYPGRAALSPILDLFITLLQMGTDGLTRLLSERKAVATELRTRIAELASRHGERLLESRGNPISFAMSIDNISLRLRPVAAASGARPTVVNPKVPVESTSTASGDVLECEATSATCPVDSPVHCASEHKEGGTSSGLQSVKAFARPSAEEARSESSATPPSQAAETYLGAMLFSRGVSGTRVVSPTEVRRIDRWTFTGYGAQCDAYPCAYITAAAAIGMTIADVGVYCDRLDATITEYKRQRQHRL